MTATDHAVAMGAPAGLDHCPLMPTYGPPSVEFVRGSGSRLWDRDGKEYLDLLSGIAVTSLGHAHPEVADAIAEQARTLLHVSNLFGTVPGTERRTHARSTDGRRWTGLLLQLRCRGQRGGHQAGPQVRPARPRAIQRRRARTEASTAGRSPPCTRPASRPSTRRSNRCPRGSATSRGWTSTHSSPRSTTPWRRSCSNRSRARAASAPRRPSTSVGVRRLCDERGILFMVDEVQTGLGRCGRWFAHQHFGVRARRGDDGQGARQRRSDRRVLGPCATSPRASNRETTPPPSAASRWRPRRRAAVLAVMEREDVPARAARAGETFERELARPCRACVDVRGLGLLIAVELDSDLLGGADAKVVAAALLDAGRRRECRHPDRPAPGAEPADLRRRDRGGGRRDRRRVVRLRLGRRLAAAPPAPMTR